MAEKLLAIDGSGEVGWAILIAGQPPRFGTLNLKKMSDLGRQMGAYMQFLKDLHSIEHFDGIAWEGPILLKRDVVDTLKLLYGLVGISYGFAGVHGLPHCEVTHQQAKGTLTGDHQADKTAMFRAADVVMKWKVKNHHEADAGAVGLVAYETLWP